MNKKKSPARTQLLRWISSIKKKPPTGCRFSEYALANSIGVSPPALRGWLSGQRRPTAAHAAKIAKLTGIRSTRW